jgi:AcrR family transcriptional regulator
MNDSEKIPPEDRSRSRGDGEAESSRDRILDVAESLFAHKGLAGTAVRDIAREAGLTAPSLYNHFEGKQALYEAVLARGVRPLVDLIEEFRKSDVGVERTGELLDRVVDHLGAHPNIAKLIQHESLTGGPNLAQMVEAWIRPITSAGLEAFGQSPKSVWTEAEQPLALEAWIHVILGHFAQAALHEVLFGVDPLSPAELERKKKFLRRFAGIMMSADA